MPSEPHLVKRRLEQIERERAELDKQERKIAERRAELDQDERLLAISVNRNT
jgi:hypothetical protein